MKICTILNRGFRVTYTIMGKSTLINLLKQEAVSIIFNWDISTLKSAPP